MTFQKALPPEKERELVVEYEDGWTINELSVIYRVSIRTVYRILAAHGAPRKIKPRRKRKVVVKVPKPLKPCGTNAAYARHKRNGEYPCTPCLEAHAEDVQRHKERRANGSKSASASERGARKA